MPEEVDRVVLGTYTGGHPATLTHADRRRHLYVIGQTGVGKTTFLRSVMLADLVQGRGFAFLDPHGDEAERIAESVPAWRTNDVIYFDPSDSSHCFGFNPLQQVPLENRPKVAANIVSIFSAIWGNTLADAPLMTYIMTNAIRLLLDAPGSTLLGLPRLLVDGRYRHSLVKQCKDPVIRSFWDYEFESWDNRRMTEATRPTQTRLGTLLGSPVLRNLLGQPTSTLNLRRLMDAGQVLICNLSKGRLGEAPSHLIGALLTTAFAQAAESRADIQEEERRDFTLFIDEAQNFTTGTLTGTMSESRKWRLALCLSHQYVAQLTDELRSAILGNAGSIIAFRVGAEDSPLLARQIGLPNSMALVETPNFAARVRLIQDGVPTEPRYIECEYPEPAVSGRLEVVRARTRAKYTRPAAVVEEKIARFLQGAT